MKLMWLFALVPMLVSACGDPPREKLVGIRFQAEWPLAARRAMLEGCRLWRYRDVKCVEVEYVTEAAVEVFIDPAAECGAWYGQAAPNSHGYATITLVAACFLKKDGTVLDHNLEIVFAHEIAHTFGVDHVPHGCDAASIEASLKIDPGLVVRTHPEGGLVCGKGIMNPAPPLDLTEPTPADDMAFDLRDTKYSVVPCRLAATAKGVP